MFPDTAQSSALYGGEDFELVLCLPESIALELVDRIGQGAIIVGKITRLLTQTASRSTDILLIDDNSQQPTIQLDLQSGFKHF